MKGGFQLTKWASNSRKMLASIPAVERAPSMVNMDFGSLPNSVVGASKGDNIMNIEIINQHAQ